MMSRNARLPFTNRNCVPPIISHAEVNPDGFDINDLMGEGEFEVNNPASASAKFGKLYKNEMMSDILLKVGGIIHPAHKLVLCASSEVFQSMFNNPLWDEASQPVVRLDEGDCCSVFGEFLRYLYCGKARFDTTTILPLLKLADKYMVEDLMTLCFDYMCRHIILAANHDQLIKWLEYYNLHPTVLQCCENFVKWNFELLLNMSDVVTLRIDLLEKIFLRSDLIIYNEQTIFGIVVNWLNYQRDIIYENVQDEEVFEATFAELIKRAMSLVRFPMMTPKELAELLISPLSKPPYHQEFIERMVLGMAYHHNQREQVNVVCQQDGGRLIFTPRLYTAEKWCSELVIENFQLLRPFCVHTLMFSTNTAHVDYAGDRTCDWVIDVYPKGVWFRKSYLIVFQGTVELPELIMHTVRVAVTCQNPPVNGVKVKIGVLIHGEEFGITHIRFVTISYHRFTQDDNVINIDDVLHYDSLNDNKPDVKNPLLVGNSLKMSFVIVPLSDESIVEDEQQVNVNSSH